MQTSSRKDVSLEWLQKDFVHRFKAGRVTKNLADDGF